MKPIMNAITLWSTLSAFLMASPAHASTSYDAQPVPAGTQSVSWDRGVALFQSTQPHGQLGVKFLQYDDDKLFFLVTYKNKSDYSVNFGIDQIVIHDADGVIIKVFNKDELIRSIKRGRDTKKFFAILGATAGVIASVAASQQSSTGNGYDNHGNSYTYTQYYTDSGILTAGSVASIGAGALVLTGANKNANVKIQYLNDNYLSRQTILPGGDVYGVIETKLPKIKDGKGVVDIIVNEDGDAHDMKYEVSEQ